MGIVAFVRGFINPAILKNQGLIHPGKINQAGSEVILIEIPSDFQEIRKADLSLAHDWRLHTRRIFEDTFNLGYRAFDFIFQREPSPRSFYLLERKHEN